MKCEYCGKQNKESANYCAQCGRRLAAPQIVNEAMLSGSVSFQSSLSESAPAALDLSVSESEHKSSSQTKKAYEAQLKLRLIITLLFGILLLACAAALGGSCGGSSVEPQSAYAPTVEPTVGITPIPTPSPKPFDMLKPTPTPRPTVSPKPFDMLKPTPKPTPEPTLEPTPIPEDTPAPSEPAPEWDEDCVPIDALCEYMLHGGADNIRAALPPEYLAYVVDGYGVAGTVLGGDDAVIEYAGKLLLTGIKLKYGKITEIEYKLISRRTLDAKELEELCSRLSEYGMTTMPTEAHFLRLKLSFRSANGSYEETLAPHVLLIDGNWHLDPEDLDF